MTSHLLAWNQSDLNRGAHILQGLVFLGASVFASLLLAGCRPDAADAKAQSSSDSNARSQMLSPWPMEAQTRQLRQFTKHDTDLEKNPTLAMINIFPDNTLPESDITPIGVDMITVDELEDLIAQGGWGLLDVRKGADVRKTGVIPGAVRYMYSFEGASAPAGTRMLTPDVVADLMAQHPKGVIVYCNGPKCFRSYNACLAIVQSWGFPANRVRWFRGGAPAWRQSPLIPASSASTESIRPL